MVTPRLCRKNRTQGLAPGAALEQQHEPCSGRGLWPDLGWGKGMAWANARGTEDEGKLSSLVRVVLTRQARGKVVDDKTPALQETPVAQQ